MNSLPNHNNSAKVSGTKRSREDEMSGLSPDGKFRKLKRDLRLQELAKRCENDTVMWSRDLGDEASTEMKKADSIIGSLKKIEADGAKATIKAAEVKNKHDVLLVELDKDKMIDINSAREEAAARIEAEEGKVKAKAEEGKQIEREILQLQQKLKDVQSELKTMEEELPDKIAEVKDAELKEIAEVHDCDEEMKATLKAEKSEINETLVHFQLEASQMARVDIPAQVAVLNSFLQRRSVARDVPLMTSIKEKIADLQELGTAIETNATTILSDCQNISISALCKLFGIASVDDIRRLPVRLAPKDDSKSFNAVEPIITYLRVRNFECNPQYQYVWTENKEFEQFVRDYGISASWQHALPPSINNLNKPQWHRFLCFILDISEDDE